VITYPDIEKLLAIRTEDPSVISLYLRVPIDPTEHRALPARVDELLEMARHDTGGRAVAGVPEADRQQIRKLLQLHGRDWLNHTVAIFACDRVGLSEAFALPCVLADRAVLATRPHVRPLLVALQRCPGYRVAIVDRRHAWVFQVAGDRIETVAATEAEGVPSAGFGGWYGLDSHRINERIMQLSQHHFHDTAALLSRAMLPGDQEPLVVGGHKETIPQFLAVLSATVRDRVIGSFFVDPHTMTPARVRALAGPVVDEWLGEQEQRLVAELRDEASDRLTVTGLSPCLDAVNSHAVRLLVVPAGGLIAGYSCQRCGALSCAGDRCPHGLTESRWVPDLLEEMVTKAIEDGAQVEAVHDPPGDVAARLRFPLTKDDGR